MTNYVTVEGKAGIVTKVIAHSKSAVNGKEILTFEVQYPRMIHAESRTHRVHSLSDEEVIILSGQNSVMSDPMLSRNAASSRAIPFKKMLEQLTARPVRFGQANPGMQDKGGVFDSRVVIPGVEADSRAGGPVYCTVEEAWVCAQEDATAWAESLYDAGYHKQIYNRLVEPFQMVKTIITATEWNNFFWLRDDDAADPTIAELARCMKVAKEQSVPQVLQPGEWHLPYLFTDRLEKQDGDSLRYYLSSNYSLGDDLSTEDAIKVSSARCAAVSFRNTDYDLEKSLQVYERLVGDERKHGSAMEHQAMPVAGTDHSRGNDRVNLPFVPYTWQEGISHVDRNGNLWSGNFCGWVQHRKLIAGENKAG